MAKRTKIDRAAFEGLLLQKMEFTGTVFSGKGRGKKFTNLDWVERQIREKLNFIPFPGTLNILLEKGNQKRLIDTSNAMEIFPEKGYFPGKLFKAQINGFDCAIVIPVMPNYPSDVLEIIAPVYLREKLRLTDGSRVVVTVVV